MSLDNAIRLTLKNGGAFTSFRFYTEFLPELTIFYRSRYKGEPPYFVIDRNLKLEPSVLPLLIALGVYLKNYHKQSIFLDIENDFTDNDVIRLLLRSDFLYIIGNNTNPTFPIGKRIFQFDQTKIGALTNKQDWRSDHKVRIYSMNDTGVIDVNHIKGEEAKRDFLIEHFSFVVVEHFYSLLSEMGVSENAKNNQVDILSELITNGLYHSGSDAYVMMFNSPYKTICSIADNGIGLQATIKNKEASAYYEPYSIVKELTGKTGIKVSEQIQICILSIFETFYYSMLKERQGLFDLMLNIVVNCQGYFRLHCESVQIIVSARMMEELNELQIIRNEITHLHNTFNLGRIQELEFTNRMIPISQNARTSIIKLAHNIFKKYTEDVRYSALRLLETKFNGVHIETEIPIQNN
ncbi:hypothetical protein [Mucilaginibacter sp. L196]|uniref:hypothetical protein n=1 Tax=Mucilaginibacter sp. L196 TaxID=1641870 RepID=UPI00131DDA8E|nr:hypothetical protein [Mucilaginibacter sp. L196]